MNRFLLTALIALTTTVAAAQTVYKQVDEHGNVTFTDSPTANNAEAMELPELNTQAPPPLADQPVQEQNRQQPTINYQLTLLQPQTDTQIMPGQRQLAVMASLSPAPQERMSFELLFDGEVLQTAASPSFVITEPYRGTHSISVRAVDDYGSTIAISESVIVHVIRPVR